MAEILDLKFSGLYTSGSPFSSAPPGAFEIADNVLLRNANVVEPRRGYTASVANPSGTMTRVFTANGLVYTFAASGALRTYSAGTGWSAAFTDATSANAFLPPDSTNPVRLATSNKSQFFTTSVGVKCSDSSTTRTAALAGLSAVPFGSTAGLLGSAGGTYLATGASAAYYVVLCYFDANKNLVQSPPSARLVVTNNGIAGVSQTIPIAGAAYVDSGGAGPSVITVTCPSPHGMSSGNTASMAYNASEPGGLANPFLTGSYVVTVNSATVFHYTWTDNLGSKSTTYSSTMTPPGVAGPANVTVSAQLPIAGASRATFAQLYRSNSAAAGVTASDECFQVAEHLITAAEVTAGVITFTPDVAPDSYATVPLYTNALTGTGIGSANVPPPMARELCAYNGRLLYANTQEHHSIPLTLLGTVGLSNGSTLIINGVTYVAGANEDAVNKKFQLYTSGTPAQNIDGTARSLCRVVTKYNYLNAGRITAEYTSTGSDQPGKMLIREAALGGAAFTLNAGQDNQACWVPDLSKAATIQTSDNNRQVARLWWSNDGQPWGVPADNWAQVGAADQDILRCILVRSTVFIFKKDGVFTLQGDTPDNYDLRPFDPTLVLLAPESASVVGNQIFCFTNRGAVYVSEAGVSLAVSEPIERDLLFIGNNFNQFATTAFGVSYEGENLWLLSLPASGYDVGCSQQYVYNLDPVGWTRWTIPNAVHGVYDPASQSLTWVVGNVLWIERKAIIPSDFQNPDGTAINCVIRTLPIACGNPLFEKTFRTMMLSFQQANFTSYSIQFDSDIIGTGTPSYKTGPGGGFGNIPWGGLPFGINSRALIVRADMPQAMGQATTLSMQLTIAQAQTFWRLQGASLLFDMSTSVPRRG